MRLDHPNLISDNISDEINYGFKVGHDDYLNHPDMIKVIEEFAISDDKWDKTVKLFATIKEYVDDYDEQVTILSKIFYTLKKHVKEAIDSWGDQFVLYDGDKPIVNHSRERLLALHISGVSNGKFGFFSPISFMNTIVEVVNKTTRFETWLERHDDVETSKALNEFVNKLLSDIHATAHKDILKNYSKFFQVNRDMIWNKKTLTFDYIEDEFIRVNDDLAISESKLGWSTAFFTILISTLITVGFSVDYKNIWWILLPVLIMPLISLALLIWGMTHARSNDLYRILDEEKMLFLRRGEGDEINWQVEFGRSNVARIIDTYYQNKSINVGAMRYLVESNNVVTYEKEKTLLLVKQYRAIAKRKSLIANIASAITFIFPLFLLARPGKIYARELKAYKYNDKKEE